MANAVWPISLPTEPFVRAFKEALPKNTIRTPMEVGPDKVRRRSTARVKNISFLLPIPRADVPTFEAFFEDTLGDGSLPFDFTHPRLLTTLTFRFREDPGDITPDTGAAWWNAMLNLEILP
jgi:hypothetical protein